MSMEDFVGRRPHPVLAAFSGLTFAVLVAASFWGGFVLAQNPPAAHVAAATSRVAAPAAPAHPASDPAVMSGMSGQSAAPALDALARAAGAGKIYPAGAFAAGERTLPDGMKLATYTLDHGAKVFHLTASLVH
jgi:hypothetical protein